MLAAGAAKKFARTLTELLSPLFFVRELRESPRYSRINLFSISVKGGGLSSYRWQARVFVALLALCYNQVCFDVERFRRAGRLEVLETHDQMDAALFLRSIGAPMLVITIADNLREGRAAGREVKGRRCNMAVQSYSWALSDLVNLAIVPAGENADSRHPFISRYENVCSGEPVIAGTRVTVRAIVEYDRLYHSVVRTLRALPHITRKQVEDALGYYADHAEEIDAYIAENERAYDEGARHAWKA